jgi:hypothetical protein
MALKDLIAQKAVLTEQAIEELVSELVRYDVEEKEIAVTPAFAKLSAKAKVLVYLVALQGWPFVTDDAPSTAAQPAHIERALGIPGGTLRPILKDLKDRHLISVRDGAYAVRTANLAAIRSVLEGKPDPNQGPGPKRAKAKRRDGDIEEGRDEAAKGKEPRKGSTHKKGTIGVTFDGWIDAGFFDQPRSLADVQKRFAKEGIILPQTSIPIYLLRAVRRGRLSRDEADVGGRKVWAYQKQ